MTFQVPKILVLGATGAVGSQVCVALANKNVAFRAAVHKIEKSESIKKLGSNIETVEVDIYNPESLVKALDGIENVFFLLPPGQTHVGHNMIPAMKNAGVKYVAKLSALGSDGGKCSFILAREHADVEAELKKEGIPFTSLQPSSFCTNITQLSESIKKNSMISNGLNRDSKMNFIDPRDIGEIAAVCLENPTKYAGQAIEICGPDTITYDDITQMISEEVGRKISFIPMSDEEVRAQAKQWGFTDVAIEAWADVFKNFRNGAYDYQSDAAEKVLGRKLGSVKKFIHDNREAFL